MSPERDQIYPGQQDEAGHRRCGGQRGLLLAALLSTGLLLGPALAHLLELPAKLGLSGADYLTVQRLYRGWSLLGIPTILNLMLVAALAWLMRAQRAGFRLAFAALACLVAAQAVFWTWTFPANVATGQWTMLPQDWDALRRQWELSHAAGCGFTLGAFACLAVLGVIRPCGSQRPR